MQQLPGAGLWAALWKRAAIARCGPVGGSVEACNNCQVRAFGWLCGSVQQLPGAALWKRAAIARYGPVKCTDKKEKQIFLVYKEIQNGAVAKSYKTNGLLIYGEIVAHFLIHI